MLFKILVQAVSTQTILYTRRFLMCLRNTNVGAKWFSIANHMLRFPTMTKNNSKEVLSVELSLRKPMERLSQSQVSCSKTGRRKYSSMERCNWRARLKVMVNKAALLKRPSSVWKRFKLKAVLTLKPCAIQSCTESKERWRLRESTRSWESARMMTCEIQRI